MGLIGHNGGPSLDGGRSWRTHCWRAARHALLPTLPIEVVRGRVRRAADLGLDYRTYASVRAQTGHDVVAFLFSSNALRATMVQPAAPADVAVKLAGVRAERLGLAVAPLSVPALALANPALDDCHPAPFALARWSEARDRIRAALGRLPRDGVILVGAHGLEADWCAAGRLAGYLPAERYFGA
ncbi:hypothetical protein [Pseudogemmobacter blasticus]|uniref:Uncharacterized protein n=1 Tax=Fuscovulum blasticum DSM 2131 TaxID=1188250 RepID=A0A2T4JDP7_FUSBL|nr:hypothetical protein [Fuscovulum blasticum]PTE16042.1 hypothetical protein C5F44_03150 [Fuscovulum blasticum DSM 2131]